MEHEARALVRALYQMIETAPVTPRVLCALEDMQGAIDARDDWHAAAHADIQKALKREALRNAQLSAQPSTKEVKTRLARCFTTLPE